MDEIFVEQLVAVGQVIEAFSVIPDLKIGYIIKIEEQEITLVLDHQGQTPIHVIISCTELLNANELAEAVSEAVELLSFVENVVPERRYAIQLVKHEQVNAERQYTLVRLDE